MPDYSIRIVPVNPSNPKGSARFVPQNGVAGGTQEVWDGDTLTWNNTTDTEHWPWPTDANYQPVTLPAPERDAPGYMSDEIAAHGASRPTYPVDLGNQTPPLIIHYYCKNHPNDHNERGTVRIIAVPTP
jgi:hypothetical protein